MPALNHFSDIFLIFTVPKTAIEPAHSPCEWCFSSQTTIPSSDTFVFFFLWAGSIHPYSSADAFMHWKLYHRHSFEHEARSIEINVYLTYEAIPRAWSSSFMFLKFNCRQSFPQFQGLSSLLKASFAGSQRTFPLVDLLKYFIPYIKLTINFPISPYEHFTSLSHSYSEYPQGFCHVIWRKLYDMYIAECILCTIYHKAKYYVTTKTTRCIWKLLYIMLIRNPIPSFSN